MVDASTLFAGPMAAMHLGDMGARVVKVEHPEKPDPSRGHGPSKDGENLWWKTLGRNKQNVTLDLSTEAGQEVFSILAERADVVIENFRPGTLERWGLGYERLAKKNPGLVLARVTGFGQIGPYRSRAGFGTLAEAMSGFAAMTGDPEGPPSLPPFGLADGIASLATAYAVMVAIHHRDATGHGQELDVAIIEPILALLGPQITRWDQLRTIQPRTGNRSINNAPRNTYLTSDSKWVAVSTSAQSVAERVMELVGKPELVSEEWFATGAGRAAHADEIDQAVATWIGNRTQNEVLKAFEQAEAAAAPVYDASDIVEDPQFNAIGAIQEVSDPALGKVAMQGALFRMSDAKSRIDWTGRPHGSDTLTVLRELGFSDEQIASMREEGAC